MKLLSFYFSIKWYTDNPIHWNGIQKHLEYLDFLSFYQSFYCFSMVDFKIGEVENLNDLIKLPEYEMTLFRVIDREQKIQIQWKKKVG